jgi:hypothetical protein
MKKSEGRRQDQLKWMKLKTAVVQVWAERAILPSAERRENAAVWGAFSDPLDGVVGISVAGFATLPDPTNCVIYG